MRDTPTPEGPPMWIDEALLTRFHDTIAHRKCARTAETYLQIARECLLYLTVELDRPVLVQDLTRKNLQKWLDGLGGAPATTTLKCAAVLRLSRYIRRDEDRPAPEVLGEDLEIPEVPPRLPQFLTVPQAAALVAAPLLVKKVGVHRLIQLRDVAILETLNAGGLRASELLGLNLDAVLRDTPRPGVVTLRVLGKRKRQRYVPIGGQAAVALVAYLQVRAEFDLYGRPSLLPKDLQQEPAVFLSQERVRLSHRALHELVVRYGRRIGLKVWPHLLRHTCATQLLSSGAGLREVQEFLGHASPLMTSLYAHVDLEHLYSTCTARHPRSRPQGSESQGRHNPLAHEIADILHERMNPEPQGPRQDARSDRGGVCADLGPMRCGLPAPLAVSP